MVRAALIGEPLPLLCRLLALVAGSLVPLAAVQAGSQPSGPALPDSAAAYLREHFPGASIPRPDDLYQFPGERPEAGQPSPFVCAGDFNGDGLEDLALLVRNVAKRTLTLVALHQTGGRGYTHFVVQTMADFPDRKPYTALSCRPPGTQREVEGPTFTTKSASIALSNLEGSGELFVFEGNRYRRVITGD